LFLPFCRRGCGMFDKIPKKLFLNICVHVLGWAGPRLFFWRNECKFHVEPVIYPL
jgi:hypothetical protein